MTFLKRRNACPRLAAGLDVGATAVRVALVESDQDGRRVRAIEREPLSADALDRGLVRDHIAVERAARSALARAEERADRRAQILVVAVAADDLRSYRHTARVSRSGDAPVTDAELRRAGERARREAAHEAVRVVGDEAGLRRVALVALQAAPAGVALDGRPLVALGRQRGAVLDIELVVPVLPLAGSTGLESALAPLGREARFVAAPLALGALVAESAIAEAIVLDVGADLTGVSVVREGAPLGARAFSVGARALANASAADAATWARCAVLAAADLAGGSSLPTRVLLAGGGALLPALPDAIGDALARLQPTFAGTAETLRPELLRRLDTLVAVEPTDLIAVAAGAA